MHPAAPAADGPAPPSSARISGLVWAASAAAVGVCIVANRALLHLATADAILMTLMSTQDLTLFYWGQDRLANLVPLVAMPVRSEWWNFATQMTLIGVAYFALLGLYGAHHLRHTRRNDRYAAIPVTILVTGLLTTWALTDLMALELVFVQQYALSTSLALVGLRLIVAWRPGPVAVGGALVLAATLVNPSVVVLAPVAWLVQPPDAPWRSRPPITAVAAMIVAFGITNVLARTSVAPPDRGRYHRFSPTAMIDNFMRVLDRIGETIDHPIALVVLAAAAVLLWARRARMSTRLKLTYLCAPPYALAFTFVFGGNQWVIDNILSQRYFFPLYAAAMLLLAGAVGEIYVIAIDLVEARTRLVSGPNVPWAVAATVAVVVAVTSAMLCVWALHRINIDVVDDSRTTVDGIAATNARLVAGDYWAVWPVVVDTRSRGVPTLGVTQRSHAIVDEIVDEIERQAATSDTIEVVCAGADAATCAGWVHWWTGHPWRIVDQSTADPFTIWLAPDG